MRRIARGLDKFVIKSGEPFIVPVGYGENKGQLPRVHDIKEPLSTVVGSTKQYVCDPLVTPYVMSNNSGNAPHDAKDPLPTQTTGDRNYVVAPSLIQYHSEQNEREVRGQRVDQPIQTVDAANRYGMSAAWLTQYFSGDGHYHSVEEPLATITTMEREGVTAAFLSKFFTGVDGARMEEPMPTVTGIDHNSCVLSHLAHFKGKDKGQHPKDPMMTLTAKESLADVRTTVVKWDGQTELGYWSNVRAMLNKYCEYDLKDDEILLLNVRGTWYFISDIGLRMLAPRELYDAMGFPHDYIIDTDINGNPISRADQVARCGNAVCPPVAEALVRANLPECCRKIRDMADLHNVMVG